MLFATTLNAQEQPWSFGAKAGASISLSTGLDKLVPASAAGAQKVTTKVSPDLCVTGGLTAGYTFHKNVGVGLELLYVRLGGKLEISTELPSDATDQKKKDDKPYKLQILSHNIAVPVMLKLFPMGCDPDKGILTVDLGIQFLFPISVAVKHTPRDEKSVPSDKLEKFKDGDDKEFDKSAQFRSMTGGLIAGVSYEFPEIGLTVEGRGYFGMINTLKDDSEAKKYRKDKMGLEENKNVRNNYAAISVGYNFARLLMN